MKKFCSVIILCVLILSLLVSCTNENAEISFDVNSTAVADIQNTADTLPERFKGCTVTSTFVKNDYAFLPTMDNIVNYSECSVLGTVKGIEYVSLGTNAWTVLDVSVEETLSGNISSGTDIKVYTYGGYILLREMLGDSIGKEGTDVTDEELDNTVVYVHSDETELPEIGSKYVFYLVDGNDMMENGSYEELFGKYGRLEANGDLTEFTRTNADNKTEKYAKSELLK